MGKVGLNLGILFLGWCLFNPTNNSVGLSLIRIDGFSWVNEFRLTLLPS